MLDIPCGDGYWMSQVPFELERYIAAELLKTWYPSATPARARVPGIQEPMRFRPHA